MKAPLLQYRCKRVSSESAKAQSDTKSPDESKLKFKWSENVVRP